MLAAMIVFASDLHLGITTESALVERFEPVAALEPRALVLVGDIAESPAAFRRALRLLADVAPLRGYVPGNHDIWSRGGVPSALLLRDVLPTIAAEEGWEALEGRIWRLDDVAVVATMGWYDYSAIGASHRHLSAQEIARQKRAHVNDATQIDWPWSDVEVAARCREGVERRLRQLQADSGVRRVLVASHVPAFEEQMSRMPDSPRWELSNAYFGHLTLGEVIRRFEKVSDVVSGHTHFARDAVVPRSGMAPLRVQVIGSEYRAPAFVALDETR